MRLSIIDLFQNLLDYLRNLGDLGIFLISLIGSGIPFFPLPYLLVVIFEAQHREFLGLLTLGIAAGLGGATGKLTVYYLGRGIRVALSEERKKEAEFFSKMARKYGAVSVFIFALTPLPDDVLYFPLGVVKFDVKVFLLANLLGKSLLGIFVAFLSGTYFNVVKMLFGENGLISSIIAILFALILAFILLRVRWSLVYNILEKEGIRGILKNLRRIIR